MNRRWHEHIIALLITPVLGCAQPQVARAPEPEHESTQVSATCLRADPFEKAGLKADVTFLASPALDGRAPGSAGELAARKMIAERLSCLGIESFAETPGYIAPFTDSDENESANVIGYLPGLDPTVAAEVVVVSAHPDHFGNGQLGANDNASGVAALLAIASQLHKQRSALRRTVVFAAFGSEESGFEGSEHFMTHLPAQVQAAKIVYVVNMDMVGSYALAQSVDALGTFVGTPGRAVVKQLAPAYPELAIDLGSPSDLSDHVTFCKRGIPYVFLWTEDTKCYHKACDTEARIDYQGLSHIASLVSRLTLELANSPGNLLGQIKPGVNVCSKP